MSFASDLKRSTTTYPFVVLGAHHLLYNTIQMAEVGARPKNKIISQPEYCLSSNTTRLNYREPTIPISANTNIKSFQRNAI